MFSIWIVVFVASLWILVKSADYFTDFAEKLGKVFRLPNFIVGVLIVAVGTSLPELATSVAGVTRGESEFLSANILGTVIVNILLGLSLAVIITNKKARFNWNIVSNDLPFFLAAIFLVGVALMDGKFSVIEAAIFLVGYIVYVIYTYHIQKTIKEDTKGRYEKKLKKEIASETDYINGESQGKHPKRITKLIILAVLALIAVAISSHFVVEAVINIANILGMGTSVIAATAVAIGTSLPEILVAIHASRRGNFDLAIGDIIGSNIFDLFVIFGVVGLFTPLTISKELFLVLMIFLVGAFFLMWLAFIDKKLTRSETWMFILLYAMFVGKLFNVF